MLVLDSLVVWVFAGIVLVIIAAVLGSKNATSESEQSSHKRKEERSKRDQSKSKDKSHKRVKQEVIIDDKKADSKESTDSVPTDLPVNDNTHLQNEAPKSESKVKVSFVSGSVKQQTKSKGEKKTIQSSSSTTNTATPTASGTPQKTKKSQQQQRTTKQTTSKPPSNNMKSDEEDNSELLLLRKDALLSMEEEISPSATLFSATQKREEQWSVVKKAEEVEILRKKVEELETELAKANREKARKDAVIKEMKDERGKLNRTVSKLERQVKYGAGMASSSSSSNNGSAPNHDTAADTLRKMNYTTPKPKQHSQYVPKVAAVDAPTPSADTSETKHE